MNIKQLETQLQKHAFIDGLLELLTGVWFLMLGVYYLLETTLDQSMIILFVFVMPLLPILLGPGTQQLKRLITAPRVGYVKYPPQEEITRQRWRGIIVFGIALIIGAGAGYSLAGDQFTFQSISFSREWIPLAVSLCLAGAFFFAARNYQIMRFYILSGALLAAGILSLVLANSLTQGIIYTTMFSGAILLTSGVVTLALFLYNHPIQDVEDVY